MIKVTPLLLVFVLGCGDGALERCLHQLTSDDVTLRRQAARQLAELKPQGTKAQQALERAAADSDREVRRLACVALGEIGTGGKAVLEKALADPEFSVQLAAAFALLKIDPESESAISVLKKTMKLGEGGVIVSVTQMGPKADWAVPTLVDLLRDRRPGIRRLAADGLGQIAVGNQSALTALKRAQQDPDDRVRDAAAKALERLRS